MTFGADPGGESPAEIGACPSTVFWLPFSSENWSTFQPESAQTSHPQMGMQLTAKTAPEWRSIPSGIHLSARRLLRRIDQLKQRNQLPHEGPKVKLLLGRESAMYL